MSQDKGHIVAFPWTGVIEEARVHCSTLYNVVQSCTVTKGVW